MKILAKSPTEPLKTLQATSSSANVSNIGATLAAGAGMLPAGNAFWSSVSIIDNTYNDKTDTGIYPIVTLTYGLVYEAQSNYNKAPLSSASSHGSLTKDNHTAQP